MIAPAIAPQMAGLVCAGISMLDKLLDINQLEAGIVRPTIIDFPIKSLLDELRTEFKYYTETNGLDWRVVSSSLTVRSDPRLLEQIMASRSTKPEVPSSSCSWSRMTLSSESTLAISSVFSSIKGSEGSPELGSLTGSIG